MTTLRELGETAVLERIFPRLPVSDVATLGPGDDAAVIAALSGQFVVTTDLLVEGPDFRLAWSSPEDLGWKAAASNLADVAAMGARPTGLVVALAAPPHTEVDVLEGIADGLRLACEALAPGCGVVGGDLSAAQELMIAVTAFGDLDGRSPVLRSGARPGDVVALAGEVGLAARGLHLLFRYGTDADGEASSAGLVRARERDEAAVLQQLRPWPPIKEGVRAAIAGARAMMDVSDGLLRDTRRLARASAVSVDFDPACLGETDQDVRWALAGGEDHSLLATFPASVKLPTGFRVLGQVRAVKAGDESTVTVNGAVHDERGGWDPLRDWTPD